jgi:hypothetical protein
MICGTLGLRFEVDMAGLWPAKEYCVWNSRVSGVLFIHFALPSKKRRKGNYYILFTHFG